MYLSSVEPQFRRSVVDVHRAIREAWAPRPRLSITEIAEKHRWMVPEDSGETGPYRVSRFPYTREPQDRLVPWDPVQIVVLEWAAQTGKSAIGLNWALATILYYPAPMLVAFDKEGNAEDWSKNRLEPMVAQCPQAAARMSMAKGRSKDSTILTKSFPGGRMKMAGAQSPSDLCSMPARNAIIEELDRHQKNVGKEGSSAALIIGRQGTFGLGRKALIVSTPTVTNDSPVEEYFLRGDQRYFEVPCLRCERMQVLRFRDPASDEKLLIWPEGRPEDVYYQCPHCGHRMFDRDKNLMLPRGAWRATRPDLGAGGTITSYHLSGLYSPVGMVSWTEIARDWEAAMRLSKAGNQNDLRSFVNIRLAETFDEPGEIIDPKLLSNRASEPFLKVPKGVLLITAGVDVQDNRIEVAVWGWGRGMECWLLGYFVIDTDPLDKQTWRDLDQLLIRTWEREDGASLRIESMNVDTGYRTQAVYEYCRSRRRYGVHAIKGIGGPQLPIWNKKARHGGKNKDQGTFFLVGTDTAKDELQKLMKVTTPGPGFVHIPKSMTEDWFAQLTSEKRAKVKAKNGKEYWGWRPIKDGARNEALDTFVYALSAVHERQVGGRFLEPDLLTLPSASEAVQDPAPDAAVEAPPPPSPPPVPRSTVDLPASPPEDGARPRPAPTDDWLGDGGGDHLGDLNWLE